MDLSRMSATWSVWIFLGLIISCYSQFPFILSPLNVHVLEKFMFLKSSVLILKKPPDTFPKQEFRFETSLLLLPSRHSKKQAISNQESAESSPSPSLNFWLHFIHNLISVIFFRPIFLKPLIFRAENILSIFQRPSLNAPILKFFQP